MLAAVVQEFAREQVEQVMRQLLRLAIVRVALVVLAGWKLHGLRLEIYLILLAQEREEEFLLQGAVVLRGLA